MGICECECGVIQGHAGMYMLRAACDNTHNATTRAMDIVSNRGQSVSVVTELKKQLELEGEVRRSRPFDPRRINARPLCGDDGGRMDCSGCHAIPFEASDSKVRCADACDDISDDDCRCG